MAPPHRAPGSTRNEQAKRYKDAAEAALDQLEWAIAYLRRIRKPNIAKALEANRASIMDRSRLKRGWRREDDD